jgi:dihydrofolate reductase
MMRKIVAGSLISLDGVIENASEWMGPWFSPELGQAVGAIMGAQDTMLLGRVTYDELAAYWPKQEGEMADTMNGTPKYVVSNTLEVADWQNTTLLRGDVLAEITELKQRDGKNIGMTGSGILTSWLLHQGLVDELHLFVFPVVLGSGKRFFTDGSGKLPLKLTGSEAYGTGVVHLAYAKA